MAATSTGEGASTGQLPILPVEIILEIAHSLKDRCWELGQNGDILHAALVCKQWTPVFIRLLYSRISINHQDAVSLAGLALKLLQDDDLARSVQAVRTTDFPYRTGSMICSSEAFSVENFLNVLRSREFVNSKRTARFKFPFIDGDEPNEARFGLKWPLLTRIILLCCSNIQRLELFEPENDQHQELDEVEFGARHNLEYASQIMIACPDNMQLQRLHVRSLAPGGHPYEFSAGSGLRLSELKMTDIGMRLAAYSSCRLVYSLLSSCIRLEHLHLQFNTNAYSSNDWVENIPQLYHCIRQHKDTLRTLRVDLGGADIIPSASTDSESTVNGINTFRDFPLLETMSFEMPILFGTQLLECTFDSNSRRKAFARKFREVLVRHLPTSLKSLKLFFSGAFQEVVLDVAVERLDEIRDEAFPMLDNVEICEDEVDD